MLLGEITKQQPTCNLGPYVRRPVNEPWKWKNQACNGGAMLKAHNWPMADGWTPAS